MSAPSLTVRLSLLFATVSTTVLLAIGTMIKFQVEDHFELLDLVELSGKMEQIQFVLGKTGPTTRGSELPRQLDAMLSGSHGISAAVYTENGNPVFAAGVAEFPPAILSSDSGGLLYKPMQPVIWETKGQAFRGIAKRFSPSATGTPTFIVALALDLEHHQAFMSDFRRILWATLALGIVLSSLLGWLAARRGLAPIIAIAGITRGISAEHLDARLPLEQMPIEVHDLVVSFNLMLARLEDSFKRLSEFSSDIAHELRTPVSNLMTETQVTLSKARSADQYREILYSNLEEYDRMARMIADMLFIAKTDNRLLTFPRDDVDLVAEIDQLIDFYQALAEEQGVIVARRGDGRIVGDPLMIRRALSNLLSNAIRHTPRDGKVLISVEAAASGTIVIRVENTGDAIPDEHLPRVFDRFYRIDAARSRSSEGAGLGLAIAKSIVEAHGGIISVSSAAGVTAFAMTFPGG